MTFPETAWEECPPAAEGIDAAVLEAALEGLARRCGRDGTEETVLVRNGRLIWKGAGAARRHNVWSCTKAFTTTVLGLLVDRGLCSLASPAREHLPSLAPLYPEVRLAHFACMTSGYDGGGDQSATPFTPTEPLFPPGTRFQYWDSAMNQFLHVLTRIAGEPAREVFRRAVAEPLGIARSDWDWGDFGRIDGLPVNGGAGNKGRGIEISALALARFGHLFLNRGHWQGRRLLSREWVERATTVRVAAELPHHGQRGDGGPGSYGFGWWTNGRRADGTRSWPDAPAGTYAARGFNNNRCFVVPEWNLVFVRLGQDGNVADAVYNAFFRRLKEVFC